MLRIYPALIVCLFFCGFVAAPLGGAHLSNLHQIHEASRVIQRPVFGRILLASPEAFIHNPLSGWLNGSIWTIRYEVACYVLLAIAASMGILRYRYALLLSFCAALAFLAGPEPCIPVFWFGDIGAMGNFLVYFLAGVVFYLWRDEIPRSRLLCVISILAIALTIKSASFHHMLPVFGTYILFYLAFSKTLRLHDFGRYGDFSYGLYLYGFPIQQLVVYYMPNFHNPTQFFLLSSVLAGMCAVASWVLIEKPFLKLKSARREVITTSPEPEMALASTV